MIVPDNVIHLALEHFERRLIDVIEVLQCNILGVLIIRFVRRIYKVLVVCRPRIGIDEAAITALYIAVLQFAAKTLV